MPAKKKSAKSKRKSAKKPTPSKWYSLLWRVTWQASLAALALITLYVIYLDAKVSKQFEGNKWQLPAQVYAKSMSLRVGRYLTLEQVVAELKRLSYVEVNRVSSVGQYAINGNKLTIYRRAFDFPDGSEPEKTLFLTFSDKHLASLKDARGQDQQRDRLEPLQIARLNAGHEQDREFVPLERFPEILKDTLLVVEDRDFYHHYGVSPWAIARAFYTNLKAGRTVQGGSTITQQLAKNFYLSRERSLLRKINEALIALILDYRYSKDQILEAYLNEVYLGQAYDHGIHGLGLASEFYFARPVNELEYDEIALLIAMIKGPSYYNPRRHVERTQERRDLVLRLMAEQGLITPKEYRLSLNRPINVRPLSRTAKNRYPAYLDLVSRELKDIVSDPSVLFSGLRVFTYLDLAHQEAMEQSVKAKVARLAEKGQTQDLEVAMLSVQHYSAGISAMVGGADVNYYGYNRALDAKRNIGSLVKPAVMLSALSTREYHLGTLLEDTPLTVPLEEGKVWQPENYDKTYRESVPLFRALSQSVNVPMVRLGLEVGLEEVASTLQKLGIEKPTELYPSLLLGALPLSPFEVTQMYNTIASNGYFEPLTSITAITTADNNLVYQDKEGTNSRFAWDNMFMLEYNLKHAARVGTARKLHQTFPLKQFAGKTGTTNDLRDSWFAGYDQRHVTVVWLGRDDNAPIGLTGSQGALELYIDYAKRAPMYSLTNERPDTIRWGYFSELTGKQVPPRCGKVAQLPMRVIEWQETPACQ